MVGFSFRSAKPLDFVSRKRAQSHSALNRRRRAARLWIVAILSGHCGAATTQAVARSWLRQLAGTGPDPRLAVASGRRFIEYLRGAITIHLFASSAPNLIPHARALCALEGVLSVHLHAIDTLAES